MKESDYPGALGAAADYFGKASRLNETTKELSRHCSSERDTFARNREKYSSGGRFSFREACDRVNGEKNKK